jgi:hypothetical protein
MGGVGGEILRSRMGGERLRLTGKICGVDRDGELREFVEVGGEKLGFFRSVES